MMNKTWPLFWYMLLISLVMSCGSPAASLENISKEGEFLVYRRQSLIGEETYRIAANQDGILVRSIQGENERGRISGVEAVLRMNADLSPVFYENRRIANNDTVNILKVTISPDEVSVWEKKMDVVTHATPTRFFPVHSNIPAGVEMMLYHYYLKQKITTALPTFPRGEVAMNYRGEDQVTIRGKQVRLDRYVVEGINWGGRTIWLDKAGNLVALVKANTQIRELIRKGYEEALPFFVAGNVEEQMHALSAYTKALKEEQAPLMALTGGDVIDGMSETVKKDMTLLIEKGRIRTIGRRSEIEIPANAKVIDVSGKTLMPGLWDMHAHANQVQWAPAYLAGGVTTIRCNGNEIEHATAFRDAIALKGALGPDILLAGMTDGPGAKGNGVIRATTPQEAREVVAMYHDKGYKQIKIYNSIQPDVLKVLASEAHQRGMTVTGHVPVAVNNTVVAVESGMDQLSHSGLFLSVLLPEKTVSELGRTFLADHAVSASQIEKAKQFLLKHKTVLDPTIALNLIRYLPWKTPVETVEPDAGRIAYELFEGKRFRSGVSPARAAKAKENYTKAMQILGDFYRAGIPIVAGTDNAVPVFCLYLEIEAYKELGGLSALDAIKTATIIPAKAMGMDAETGTLEPGKQADIAILDENPLEDIRHIRTVSAVVSNGNYYESNPLWEAADFKPNNN